MKRYDLIVIGGGAGGLTVAAGAVGFGVKVALIEKEPEPGGDCLHTGCVPSKALIAAAKELHTARKTAEAFGMELSGEADYLEAYRRVRSAIADILPHDSAERFRGLGVDVIRGHARFRDEHHVEIEGGEAFYGKRIVIATGSRTAIPPIEGLREAGFLTNESVFDMQALPESLVVVGAGPVGLEMAQAFARLGKRVAVLEKGSRLLPKEDAELVPYVRSSLEKDLTLLLNATVDRVEAMPNGRKRFTIDRGGERLLLETDAVFVATGRKPNTDRLGLTDIGLRMDGDHIAVDRSLRTSIPHIYAVGDVIKPFPFTHAAGMEGKIVVANAVFGLGRKVSYDHVPWVTYTDPEIFHLGMTEEEARKHAGDGIRVYRTKLDQVDRFITDRDTNGMVKVITDRKAGILGAHAVGSGAGDWMQQAVLMKRFGHKLPDISRVVHPYPARSEAFLKTADQYWREKLFQGGLAGRIMKAYVKWFR